MKSQANTLVKEAEVLEFTATVLSDGSLSVPEELSELLRLSPGKKIPITFEDGEAKILTPQERGRRAQEMWAEYMRVNNIPPATETAAERIRKMREKTQLLRRSVAADIVLDASVVIAYLNQEKGMEVVTKHLGNACMSSVNASEVISDLLNRNLRNSSQTF